MNVEPVYAVEVEEPVEEEVPARMDGEDPAQVLRELLESDSAPIVALVLALV